MSNAESQTVAVLFTDLVGSTQRQSEVGDERFDEIRRTHFALLRDVVDAHRGTEVKNLGDGLMVVFRSASNAIAAGVQMLVECDRLAARDAELGVGVKVAVSIGDAVFEEDDWFGTPVVEAARLCSACTSGQMLVTESTRLMAGSRSRERIELVGDLDLKGLPEPVTTYEVHWESAVDATDAGVALPAMFATPEALPFAGRVDERALLDAAWSEATAGKRRAVLLAGEPGIGKTRLVGELARRVHGEGAIVLAGRSDDEMDVPFRPFAESLDHLALHAPEEVLADHVAEVGPVLARLAPAISRRTGQGAPTALGDSDAERLRLFHAATDLLGRASEISPVLLVLDDLHWADEPSLLLLRHLLRSTADQHLLVVGTYRDTDVDRAHPLAATLADLRREAGVERVALTGLTQADVLDYLVLAGGHDLESEGVELGHQIAEVTSGNPFFLSETVRHLVESGAIVQVEGRWTAGALGPDEVGVPEGVREVVGRRLSAVGDDVEALLSVAAVAGAEFDATVVMAVAGVTEGDAVDRLDRAAARTLVVEDPDRFGWYRFAHALVRQTLLEELSTTRRLRTHRALAEELERHHPDRVEEIAHHYLEAAAAGVAEQAVAAAQRAADTALEHLAAEQAMRWYRRALEAEEGLPPDPARRAQLLISLGEAAHWADAVFDVAADLLEAVELAEAAGRPDLQAMAAYWYMGPVGVFADLDNPHLVPILEAALAALDECPADQYVKERVWVLGKLSYSEPFRPDASRRLELSGRALELGRTLEDPFDVWVAVAWRLVATLQVGRHGEWDALVDEASARAAELPLTAQRDALNWELERCQRRGDPRGVEQALARYCTLFEPMGLALPGVVLGVPAVRALDQGRFEEAERLLDQYRAVAHWVGQSALTIGAARMPWLIGRGDAEAYRAALDSYPESGAGLLAVYPLQANLALLEGDGDAARKAYDEWKALFAFIPASFAVHVATAASWSTWRLGDREGAAAMLARLAPEAGSWPTLGVNVGTGPADLHLGTYQVVLNRLEEATTSLRAAVAACAATECWAWEAVARSRLADALLRAGDTEDAQEQVDACRASAQQLGLHGVLADLDHLAATVR